MCRGFKSLSFSFIGRVKCHLVIDSQMQPVLILISELSHQAFGTEGSVSVVCSRL